MKGPFFIETLARNGDVLHRHRVDTLPIRLGRGYDNDFIVDDDYAAPRHAVVELDADGALVLRDLGTRNGVVHKGRRHDRIVIIGDTVVRMGHTSLRVRAADFPVPPEVVDRTMHGWEGALPGLAGIMLVGAVALFTRWLSDTQSFEYIRYLQALAYFIGAALLWAGIWAFANKWPTRCSPPRSVTGFRWRPSRAIPRMSGSRCWRAWSTSTCVPSSRRTGAATGGSAWRWR
jgi:hypothetical protein